MMTSGNLTADRRFAYGMMLRQQGDAAGAADVLGQALELAPDWAEGRFALAETLELAGHTTEAVAAFRAYLERDPADSMGAAAHLALLGANAAPAALPDAYVRRLFDDYAARFDRALIQKLHYRAPALLRFAVETAAPGQRFARVFDLGCGTGLAGFAVRDLADWLGGVDLSPAMVKEAEIKAIYDHLAVGDMIAALADCSQPYNLILAADVLVYRGDLAPVMAAARSALAPDGLFAFTLQCAEKGDYILGKEQRYSHSSAYIETTAKAAGFAIVSLENAVSRREKGADVPGLVAVLRRE